MVRAFAWATTVGRVWFPRSSGHQPRWLARRVCSVVFGGLRGTCVLSTSGLLNCSSSIAACSAAKFTRPKATGMPPERRAPLAMTSILPSSCRWTLSMFHSMSRLFVVTRAPASRHTLAAIFSSGTPRRRNTSAWAQAEGGRPRDRQCDITKNGELTGVTRDAGVSRAGSRTHQ